MAKVGGIFKVCGKIGNTVFMEMGGKSYARTLPINVRDPQTPSQLACRARFHAAVSFYQRLHATSMKAVWKQSGARVKLSGFNLFMKVNLKMFSPEGEIVDFDGLRLAVGNRTEPRDLSAAVDDRGRLTLRWTPSDGNVVLNADDRLHVVLLYGDRLFSPVVVEGVQACRGDGGTTIDAGIRPGVALHVYAFFSSPGGDAFSDSKHVAV